MEEQKSSEKADGPSKRKGKKEEKREPTLSEQDLQEDQQAPEQERAIRETGELNGHGRIAGVETLVEPGPSAPSPQRYAARPLADRTNTADPTRTAPILQPTNTETAKEGTNGPTRQSCSRVGLSPALSLYHLHGLR